MKETPIREGLTFTLRADFLNATNTPQWYNGPVTDSTSSNFGRIAGVSDQFNLRVSSRSRASSSSNNKWPTQLPGWRAISIRGYFFASGVE